MLRIQIDMFSGRVNPEWTVPQPAAEALARQIARFPGAIEDIRYVPPILGFRGLVVEVLDGELANRHGLPSTFRIAGGSAADAAGGAELLQLLLASDPSHDEGLHERVVKKAGALMRKVREAGVGGPAADTPEEGTSPAPDADGPSDVPLSRTETIDHGACQAEVGYLNLPFWNGQAFWQLNNNCYAYGCNRRTDTFPQPGRASGLPEALTLAAVIRNATADGLRRQTECATAASRPRWLLALATYPDGDPDWDYHWYRKQSEGYWGHKQGRWPARNFDDSGRIIYHPRSADRGEYTQWGGYFYAPSTINIL